MEQDIASQVVGLGGATDFSLWKLFLRADFVVKFVIILLIACSIFSWALIFDKFKLFKKINNSSDTDYSNNIKLILDAYLRGQLLVSLSLCVYYSLFFK